MKRLLFFIVSFVLFSAVLAQDIKLPNLPKNRKTFVDYSVQERGYWGAIELSGGTTLMFSRKNMPSAGMTWINGYRFNEFLRVGLGLGLNYHINNNKVRTSTIPWSFPMFVDLRGNIISQQDRSSVPFWSVDLGGEFRGGLYFSPTIGYRLGEPRNSFIIGVAYQLTQYDTWRRCKESLNSVILKIGYEF